jgi:hypothetical protein
MTDSEFLLEITKIILIRTLIVLLGIVDFKINQKLDELIKLNTPEIIHIIPDQII